MIRVFFLASLVLSFVPYIRSATELNTSLSICPESFNCPNLASFTYPFYNNATETQCGLIKVNCTLNGGSIQLGRNSYDIYGKYVSESVMSIRNLTFERLVNDSSCGALMDNFTSPTPLLYSISLVTFITLYKCAKLPNDVAEMEAYFDQSNYNKKRCGDYNFYYNHSISDKAVPSDLPPACQVIQLPVKVGETGNGNETNIFSLLNSVVSINFVTASPCNKCQKEEGRCYTLNGQFQYCLYAKNETSVRKRKQILAICVGSVTILVVIIFCFIRKLRWRKKTNKDVNVEKFLGNHQFLAKRYTYLQVKKMTNLFELKLGQGGFGSVYKGTLSNGSLVAVKILSESKGNGEDFINEVASVGRTSHVNIVSLVGFCFEGDKKALIYEFMPNGSLEKFIYNPGFLSSSQLGWEKLHEIAIGIARGLEYLHSGCNTQILHFDIKPHNILLDKDFSPKISDFGLAKLSPERRSMMSMSLMRGTPGYIAPELFSRSFGQVSHKSDVYSYGMMILEMVGGRKNVEVGVDHTSEIYFPHWIYKKVKFNEELGLHTSMSDEEKEMVRKMIIVGLWCIQTNPVNRPTIMKALEMLEGDLESLEIPPKPYLSSP
ncbi:PR5-like receptor kinase [Lactuca sativa]|uniref:PR5-like receptor kinase n=1 Tax=Lactuca sativa TaxID=4236 RepID=UPI0022AF9B7A|nr:PR5-like receptor kinase [Lactuca sativa]